MRRFLYGIIFLLILIIVKAFYFDGWLEKRRLDTNSSVEANQSSSDVVTVQLEANRAIQPPNDKEEKMPVSKLGDSIAEKLKGKI